MRTTTTATPHEHDHAHEQDPSHGQQTADVIAHPDDEEVLTLSRQAHDNLGLKMGTATRGEYWKSLTLPGEVMEIPGKSDLSVSAPVVGVVEEVFVRAGQAVAPEDQLFTLKITDDALTTLQSRLLTSLARRKIVQKEIARLTPLIEAGTVSGSRKRELEYELSELESEQATRMQEIRARGLPESALDAIVQDKSLATKLTISVPTFVNKEVSSITHTVSHLKHETTANYSVEKLEIHPGKTVLRGDRLCSLAYHAELYVQGQAFDTDLPALNRIARENWPITAEFGHTHQGDHSAGILRDDLQLMHVDNHVDRKTQTFRFYMPLENEVSQSTKDSHGRLFQQWRFKPGQRVHLRIPVEQWQDQLMLPLDAVVVEGPNAFVFVEHVHRHADKQPADDDHTAQTADDSTANDATYIELEPVAVRLLYRDSRLAVIANDGQVKPEQRIALNNAYQLHLAIRLQAMGGGGGHGHQH